jgi:hypothetical protein
MSAPTCVVSPAKVPKARDRRPAWLIGLALLIWAGEVAWFWRLCGRNINIDAVSYLGIVRHIAEGNLAASLHGYWSPLVSWLMAGSFLISQDWTKMAHLLMLPEYLLCLGLLYRLTCVLWHSRMLGALAVLWFTLARGTVAFSVYFVGADFLLTAAMLFYFIRLLRCLENPEAQPNWLWLGTAHGVAFLAKAIAMPLFALTSLAAVLWVHKLRWRPAAAALALAALIPGVVWVGWGTALRHKYGVFTTGYQLRWNLLEPEVKRAAARNQGLAVLTDTRAIYDEYMVTDSMPPRSMLWKAKVWRPGLIRQIVRRELENLPQACKEVFVLLTPGGLLALALCALQLTRARRSCPVHLRFLWLVMATASAMLLAYCMLVFDARYALPVAPVLMALGMGFAVPRKMIDVPSTSALARIPQAALVQAFVSGLLVAGLIAVQLYWASPFRTARRDFQVSVYDAAAILKQSGARNIVVIGAGPYPEHGVGWEAGVYAAYFSQCRIVAALYEVPADVNLDAIASDVKKVAPDAVLLWGESSSTNYVALAGNLRSVFPEASVRNFQDAVRGPVGTILLLRPPANS